MTETCGCVVRFERREDVINFVLYEAVSGGIRIFYCPMHAAAEVLYGALLRQTEEVWKVAKESFDTAEGHPEKDFAESDPEGFACYHDARRALAIARDPGTANEVNGESKS